jgi:hypothetical protein
MRKEYEGRMHTQCYTIKNSVKYEGVYIANPYFFSAVTGNPKTPLIMDSWINILSHDDAIH